MFGTDVAESRAEATVGHPRGRRGGSAATATDHGNLPGRVFGLLSLVPVCALTGWLLAAFPLAALGAFRPAAVIPVATAGAVVVLWLGLALIRRSRAAMSAPWWSVAATGAIAVAFALFTALTHSEHVIPRRDAGSYIQISYWLAHHQALTYPYPAAAFGPSPGTLGFGSPAFYEHGSSLVPQFMTGWPMLLAVVDWAWGWGGMLVLPAIIGGCAVLAVAGLAARLIGPRWAPLAALLITGAWPVLRVAQSTFSEPLALLILAGGSCLLVDLIVATRADAAKTGAVGAAAAGVGAAGMDAAGAGATGRGAARADRTEAERGEQFADRHVHRIRRVAFAAGLVLAGGELVRLDFGIDFALTLPLLAGLWLLRRRAVWPFLAGALVSGGLGLIDCVFVTRPYVQVNISSVKLMVVAMAAIAVMTVLGALVAWRYGRSLRSRRWWRAVPVAGGAAVLVVAIAFVVRPYVSVDHSVTDAGVRQFTETAQGRLGLPLDGSRGYGEQSLWWVAWYLGWPVLAAALVGAVALTTRVLRGRDLAWAGVLLVYLGSSVLTLLRPGITPDHPWADRRLVVEVLPGMVLFATWTIATGNRWLRARVGETRSSGRFAKPLTGIPALPWVLTVAVVAVLIAPIWTATGPIAQDRTELGELDAMAGVCRTLHSNDSVVLTDTVWAPTIRAQCQVPVAHLIDQTTAALDQVTASIRSAGRTPVIAGTQHDALSALGLDPVRAVRLRTQQDQQQLILRPDGTMPLLLDFWVARP